MVRKALVTIKKYFNKGLFQNFASKIQRISPRNHPNTIGILMILKEIEVN